MQRGVDTARAGKTRRCRATCLLRSHHAAILLLFLFSVILNATFLRVFLYLAIPLVKIWSIALVFLIISDWVEYVSLFYFIFYFYASVFPLRDVAGMNFQK